MKNVIFLFPLVFCSQFSFGQTIRDKQLVEKVITAFQDDFNDGTFKSANSYTTDDWQHINPSGGITKGRKQVLQEVRAVHQTFLKGVTMRIESLSIRFITPSVAIGDVIHKIDKFTTPDGTLHNNEKQIKTYVVVKQNGKWLLTQDHNTVIQGR